LFLPSFKLKIANLFSKQLERINISSSHILESYCGVKMSADSSEKDSTKKRKKFLKVEFSRRNLVVAIFLIISVVTVAFSTRALFQTDISNWTIVQGIFDGEDHSLEAKHYQLNWAYHSSLVAYGEWEWNLRYFGSGSASIIFIGSDLDGNYSQHPNNGYMLEFQIGEELALRRLTSSTTSEVINSTYFAPEESTIYRVKIIRFENNTFNVLIDNVLLLQAVDDTYTSSEVLFLDWSNRHALNWIIIDDSQANNGWHDFFSGLPSVQSENVFTKISLYLPFITLGLITVFYIFRLFFAQENWTRYLVPLIIAVIIGSGYGYLVNYLRENIPEILPDTVNPTDPTPTDTPTGTDPGTTFPGTTTTPNPTPNPSSPGASEPFTGIPTNIVSIILMVVAGVFIIAAIVFVAIDFLKRREDEFHESTLDKDRRYIPTASTSDHRRRVIRAYHKASYDLIDHGAKSERSMTPSEFGDKAKNQFAFSDDTLDGLTDLYEEARYSEHNISSVKSKQAEEFSENISDEIKKPVEEKKSSKTDKESKDKSNEEK
jgi:large-conductance mechanosensitive channel